MPFMRILKTILSYHVPMNIVNGGGGANLPQGKVPPPLSTSCMLSFLCYDKGNEKSLVICSFWMPFMRILKIILLYHVPMNIVKGGGDNLPQGKVPPPSQLHACFHFYVMIKGMRRAWLFVVSECPSRECWKQFLISH